MDAPASFVTPGTDGPLVIAHRGSSYEEPEHTLAAYRRAIDAGADALECDVRLTADGYLVCMHDRTISRTSGDRGVVAARTLSELYRADFSYEKTHGDGRPVLDEERRRVLTLDTLLRVVMDAPRPVGLAIETKHPTRFAGYVEQAVVETLEEYGLARPPRDGTSRVQVMSFSEIALRRMRTLAPGIPTVFLMDRVPIRFRDGALPYGAPIAGPGIHVLRKHPSYVARVHDAGGRVHVWTVDEPADVELCVELGVDALITNRPAEVLAHLGR